MSNSYFRGAIVSILASATLIVCAGKGPTGVLFKLWGAGNKVSFDKRNSNEEHTKGSLALFLELSIFLCLSLSDSNALEELIPAVGLLHVFNAHVNPLANVLSSHTLQHLNTNGTGGDVPDFTGLSMIDAMGHTTVHRSVGLDVHDVSKVVVN
jgi:hypothetical protein